MSFNVRGIGDSVKRREVFDFLRDQYADIILLQKTHSKRKKKIYGVQNGEVLYIFAHGDSNARGVCILFKPRVRYEIGKLMPDNEGIALCIQTKLEDV